MFMIYIIHNVLTNQYTTMSTHHLHAGLHLTIPLRQASFHTDCLRFRLYMQTGKRKLFSFSFFLFWLVGAQCYRTSDVWVAECNCSCFMYQLRSSDSSNEEHCNWKCSVCLIIPVCTHNSEIWTKYSPLRATLYTD